MPFVSEVVRRTLKLDFKSFQLVVSDDHSEDESFSEISRISDSRLKLITPPKKMTMGEHWDWVSSQADGEWQIFLGQDDFLQPYFFVHAENLTRRADSLGLRAIVSRRAFYNWPGFLTEPPEYCAEFRASETLRIQDLRLQTLISLLSIKSYHSLPQGYTCSLLRSDLIAEIRSRQADRLIVSHPQDASLAASVVSIGRKALYSGIPLGWVGTSNKSAGRAVVAALQELDDQPSIRLAHEYISSIGKSETIYPEWAGSFALGDNAVYFWQAVIKVREELGLSTWVLKQKFVVFSVLAMSFIRIPPGSLFFKKKVELSLEILRHWNIPTWLGRIAFGLSSLLGYQLTVLVRWNSNLRARLSSKNRSSSEFSARYEPEKMTIDPVFVRSEEIFSKLAVK